MTNTTQVVEVLNIHEHKRYVDMTPHELIISSAMNERAAQTLKKWDGNLAAGLHAMAYRNQRSQGVIEGKHCTADDMLKRKDLALAAFEASCLEQEEYIKSDKAGALKMDKVPRAWTQAKSKLTVAMKYGASLDELVSCSACEKFNKETKAQEEQDEVAARAQLLQENGGAQLSTVEGDGGDKQSGTSEVSNPALDPAIAEAIKALAAVCEGAADVNTLVAMINAATVKCSTHVSKAFKKAAAQ